MKLVWTFLLIFCTTALSKKGYVAAGTKVKPAPKIAPQIVLITVILAQHIHPPINSNCRAVLVE